MSLLARTALAAMGVNLTVDEELTLYCEFGDLDGIIKIVKKEGFHYLFKFLEPGLIVSAWGGGNLLHLACRCGWDHIVEYLMGFKDVAVNQYSEHLGTPLHLAAQYGYPKCVQILLNHPEIDVNAPFNWIIWTYRTPLMCAAQSGHVSCVSLLLNHPDVQVNLQDAEGNTALHLAVEELFHHRYLEKGEDLHIPNYSNYVSLLFHLGDMEQGQELNIPNYSNYLGKEAYRSCVDVLLQCKSIDISIRNLRGLDIGLLINETSNKIGSRVLPSSLTRFLSGHTILEKLTNYNVARWNRTNIMLVGQGRAGKTAFTNTLIGRWFRETGSTIGAEMIDLQLYSGSIKQGQWLRQGKLTPNTETENEVEAALKDIYFQQALRSRGPIFSTKLSTTRIGEKKAFDKFGGDEDFPDQMSTLDPERKPIALNHTSSLDETSMTSSLSITDIRFPTVLSWSEQSNQPPSFKLNLLDMGGQPIFNVLHPFFMSSYGVYLVVFDMELFMSKHETYKLSCRKELKFWFNSIEMRCHEAVPVAIIGTRKDRISALSDHEKISEELEKLFKGSRLWSSIIHYYHEDSSKELNFFPINNKKWRVSTTVNQLLLKIDRTLNDAEYLKEEVPIIWMKVFDSMKATGKCALSYEEFTTIMKSKMVKEQGEATPGNAFAPTNGIFIAQYDEEKRKEMLRFLNSRGMALWIEEEGLQDIVILDPIEYFVRPATSIICKHIATKDDPSLTKHEIPEIHGKSKSALAEDWMRMIEYGMLSKRLVEDILNRFYDNAQQRRRIIGSSAVDHKNRNEEAMKKVMLLMVKYGLMVPIMINGEQSSFFIPSLLPANPSLLLLDDQRLHQRLMQRYELLSSPYTSSMTFSFFFHLPDTFEKLQSEGYSIFSGVEISELGFLPYGLFERLVKPFVERIVEPLNHSQSSDEVMLQLLKDNRLIIGFRDKIQFTYHHHKVRLTNRLSESRIEVEVESHTTREDTEEDRRKDRVVTAKIYEDLIQMIEKVLKECYASLQIMTLIPLPVSLVKKPVPSLTSSKNNNINTQHETQGADCEVFISLSQVRKLLSVCEESNEERESRDFLSRDGHLVSLQPMMMKRDSYWSIWQTNMINTSSPPPLPLPPPRPLLPGKKTHVFLSHDWGIDDRNHRRVKYISEALKMRGFIPWIDDERLVNVVDGNIVDGMDYTEVLLVFLTENYQRKVNGRNSQDYCQREFFYGMDKLRKERTIVVVLDSSLTDTSTWTGLFRFNLTGVLYQNLSNVFREDGEEVTISEEEVNGKIDGLCEVIERVRSENTPRDDV